MADTLNQERPSERLPNRTVQKEGDVVKPKSALWRRVVDVLSWGLLFALAAHLLFRDTGGPSPGSQAPSHRLQVIGKRGEERALPGDHNGPLLIKVFASWCGACKRSTWIDDLSDLAQDNAMKFVAVSVDERIESAQQAAQDWPIRGEVLFDSSGTFSQDYQIKVLPTYLLIGADNRVQRVTSGIPGPLDLRAWKQAAQGK